MESAINPVLELFDENMKHLEINARTGGGGVDEGITYLEASEDKWQEQLNEVADRIDGMAVFAGGRWFRLRIECVDFLENHIPVGQFQWFIDIVSDLQFMTGDTVSTVESQRYKVHTTKVRRTKDQSIFISDLKTYVLLILEGLGRGKKLTTPLTDIHTPEL